MLDLLFVYGTLHPSEAPAEIAAIVSDFVSLGTGSVRGRLHRFAKYPALRLDAAAGEVQGEVFRVAKPEDWAAIDAYEGYRPAEPRSSLFVREKTIVRMHDSSRRECWVYTYARDLPTA